MSVEGTKFKVSKKMLQRADSMSQKKKELKYVIVRASVFMVEV